MAQRQSCFRVTHDPLLPFFRTSSLSFRFCSDAVEAVVLRKLWHLFNTLNLAVTRVDKYNIANDE